MDIEIKKFDPKVLNESHCFKHSNRTRSKTILIIGKRATGKTTLTADLMYHMRSIPTTVMSGTEENNGYYGQYTDNVHSEYKSGVISDIINTQQELKKISNVLENKILPEHIRIISEFVYGQINIVMDDLSYDERLMTELGPLLMNSGHNNIGTIFTAQWVDGIPKRLRHNFDYVFILRENWTKQQRSIYDCFFRSIFPEFINFQIAFDGITKDYGCLVIDNTTEDCLFWHRATPDRNFKIV